MNSRTGNSLINTQISLRQHTSTIISTIITRNRIISITSHLNMIRKSSISSINPSRNNQSLRSPTSNLTNNPNTIILIKSTIIIINSIKNNQTIRNSINNTNIQSIIRTMISNHYSPIHNSTITNNLIRHQLNNTQISLSRNKSTILTSIILRIRIISIRFNSHNIYYSLISSIDLRLKN